MAQNLNMGEDKTSHIVNREDKTSQAILAQPPLKLNLNALTTAFPAVNAADPVIIVRTKTKGQLGVLSGKIPLKEAGEYGSNKQVEFRRTSRNEYSVRRHDRCSSYQWNHWRSITQRSGGRKPRYSSEVLEVPSELVRRTATDLAKECSRLRGKAPGSACPATRSPKRGRNFLLDSGAPFNIVDRDELTLAERKTIRSCKATRLNTAGGILKCDQTVDIFQSSK